jgi:hypothetical protein
MTIGQPHIAQSRLQTFTNDPAVPKPDLIDASESVRSETVAASVDDEHSDTWQCQDGLPTPFFDKLRRDHREACERPSIGVRERATKRDKRLTGTALRHGRSASSLLPAFHDAHYGHGLCGKRTPLHLLQCRANRIMRMM